MTPPTKWGKVEVWFVIYHSFRFEERNCAVWLKWGCNGGLESYGVKNISQPMHHQSHGNSDQKGPLSQAGFLPKINETHLFI